MNVWRLASIAGLAVACRGAPHERPAPIPTPSSVASKDGSLANDASIPAIPRTASSGPLDIPDGSALDCRVVGGPIELPIRAPATLAFHGDVLDAVLNDNGRPQIVKVAAGPVNLSAGAAGRALGEGQKPSGVATPCAVAADHIFCPDRSGAIHRSTAGDAEDHIVASSRVASRIAASIIGGPHFAVAYIASRQTSEGWVSEAWLAVDDESPRRVSEDGSGATSITLGQRGGAVLALMIDARTALTAMHARTITYDTTLRLGEDVVAFVGGPGDRRTRGALSVPAAGPAWSLLPIARDIGSFGLAIVQIDEPPRVDEPVIWSMYPNGIDPAPVAAVSGESATWIARVRPQTSEPASPRVLELGQIGRGGAFATHGLVATSANPTDVAIAFDRIGGLWLGWVDAGGSWLERLLCR